VDELKEAIKVIEDLRRQDPCLQRSRNRELTGSFKTFWDSAPDIDVFTKQTDGLLFTNWMIYYMTQNPIASMPKPILATVPEVITVLSQPKPEPEQVQLPDPKKRRRRSA
jgi:hypothetical protein